MPTNLHIMKKIIITTTLIGLLILLGAIVFYGMNPSQYASKQTSLFLSINHLLANAGNLFWQNITALGDGLLLFPLLSFLILKNIRAWAAFFGAIPMSTFLSHAAKAFFAMPRPAAIIEHDHINIIGHALTGATSLPSGHTITIFTTISILIWLLLKGEIKVKYPMLWSISLLAIAILVALSRIAVGAHWPFDLVLGAMFGSVGGLSGLILTYKYTAWWHWMTATTAKYIHLSILFTLSIAMLVEYAHLAITWLAFMVVIIVMFKLLTMKENHVLHL